MLYGVHGIGKSTFAAQAPAPLFIQTEDGIGDIEVDRLPLCASWADIVDCLQFAIESPDYKTVVLDSLDWAEKLIWAKVCKEANVLSVTQIDYGKGYGIAMSYWESLVGGLDAIVASGKSVIALAHHEIEAVKSPYGEAWDRYRPKLHKSASAYVQEWADEVLFATYDVSTKEVKGSHGSKREIPISSDRILYCTEKPAHYAKNRCKLPDSIPFSFEKFASLVPVFSTKG